MAAIAGAVIGGLASVGGGLLTNAAQAGQAGQQEQFQMQSQLQAEQWMKEMSNTAMSRRVTDLKSAGLNPLLAVGEGGASSPTIGALPGAQAALQNPASGLGQVGVQAGTAVQQNQIAKQSLAQQQPVQDATASAQQAAAARDQAQAGYTSGALTAKTNQDIAESKSRQGVLDAQVNSMQVQNALNDAQRKLVMAQTDKIGPEIQALMASKSRDEATAHMNNISALVGQMDAIEKQYSMQFVVQKAASAARFMDAQATSEGYKLPGLRNIADMEAGNPGVSYVREVFGWAHVGAQVGTQR